MGGGVGELLKSGAGSSACCSFEKWGNQLLIMASAIWRNEE